MKITPTKGMLFWADYYCKSGIATIPNPAKVNKFMCESGLHEEGYGNTAKEAALDLIKREGEKHAKRMVELAEEFEDFFGHKP